MDRDKMIEFLFNMNYKDDDPKHDGANWAFLESLTNEELEAKVFVTRISKNQG